MKGVLIERSVARQLVAMARNRALVTQRGGRTITPRSVDVPSGGIWKWWLCVDNLAMVGEFYRWTYTLRDPDDAAITVDGAVNKWEDANTADYVAPGIEVANIPTGFDVYPFGQAADGTKLEIPVLANYRGDDAEGAPIWWFSAPNPIDGECP